MFCNKCGAEINESVKFCKNCGAAVESSNNFGANYANYSSGANYANNANRQGGSANYQNSNAPDVYGSPVETPTYYPVDSTPAYGAPAYEEVPVAYEKKSSGKNSILIIVLCIIAVLLISAIAFVVVNYVNEGELPFIGGRSTSSSRSDDPKDEEKEVELELSVEDAPSETEDYEYVLYGTANADGCDAKLSINGVDIETVKDGKELEWQYTVALDNGMNKFEIVLYDPDNETENKVKKTVKIENTAEKITYAYGTYIYKTCEEGLNIREDHTKDSPIVFYIVPEDYDQAMICQGEEYYDGTYKWFKVKVNGYYGWVRENNVAPRH